MRWRSTLSALVLLAVALPAAAEPRLLHSERSLYRNLFVTEEQGLRCLTFRKYNAGHRQSCVKTAAPQELVFNYTKMMMGALFLNPDPKRILIIGLGGGTLPATLHGLLPEAEIEVAEIDPAVVKVAGTFFNFIPDARVKVAVDDGRVFIKKQLKAGAAYDLVMLDAFEDDYIPEHMLTREFLTEVKGVLTPHGVLAANTFSSSGLYPYESATYADVFGTFYNVKSANRVVLAQVGGLTDRETVRRNAEALRERFQPLGLDPEWLLTQFETKPDWAASARVLTDQFSPSNLLNVK